MYINIAKQDTEGELRYKRSHSSGSSGSNRGRVMNDLPEMPYT